MTIQFNHLSVTPLRVTSKFGKRNTGIKGASTYHKGIDLGRDFSKPQTPITSVASGIVTNNYWNDYRGWVVIVDHGEFKTLYQHLKSKSQLAKGSVVKAGQQLGVMGNSSNKDKLDIPVHLHMELIVKGKQIDPLPYLKNIKEEEEELTESDVKRIATEVVKEILGGNGEKEPSNWAKKDWEKAKQEGITDGSNPKGYTTREQVITMLGRKVGK
ncbi:MAG: M23 family metallopeptidase [Aminipila sp.]